MSRLRYNDIEIGYIHTQSVEQAPERDDSNTDILYWRFVIRVSGLIVMGQDRMNLSHIGISAPHPIALPQDRSVDDVIARVRHELMTDRRTLFYRASANGPLMIQVGGLNGIQAPGLPVGLALDARNGPKPLYCNITNVSGHALHVDYAIETCIHDCDNLGTFVPLIGTSLEQLKNLPPSKKPWVSNRWSESLTLDDTGRTIQKVRAGTLVTRSDMFTYPDQLRGIVTPPLQRGFQRERSIYNVSEDHLSLRYEFVDREIYLAPPAPSFRAKGSYTESTGENSRRYAEVSLELTGSKSTDKGDLLGTAVAVAMQQIAPSVIRDPKTKQFIMEAVVSTELWDNAVSVRLRAEISGTAKRVLGLQADTANFVRQPLSGRRRESGEPIFQTPFEQANNIKEDSQLAPIIGTRGTAGVVLLAAALQDPCLQSLIALSTRLDESPNAKLSTVGGGQVQLQTGTGPQTVTLNTQSENPSFTNPATVIITPLEKLSDDDGKKITDELANYSKDNQGAGIYDSFVVKKRHIHKTYKLMAPNSQNLGMSSGSASGSIISETDPDEEVMELGTPSHRLIVQFKIEKLGEPPDIPDPTPVDSNMIYLDGEFETVSLQTGADGQQIRHTVYGEYRYGFVRWASGGINPALPPWMNAEVYSSSDPYSTTVKADQYERPFRTNSKILFPNSVTGQTLAAVFNGSASATFET